MTLEPNHVDVGDATQQIAVDDEDCESITFYDYDDITGERWIQAARDALLEVRR